MSSSKRNALLALLLIAPIPSIGVALGMFIIPGPVGMALWTGCKILFYGLPVFWLLVVDRKRISLSPARRGGLWVGTGLGLLISATIIGFYLLLPDGLVKGDALREVAETNGFATLAGFLGISAWVVFVNALLEEYAYRWFLFTRCRALMPTVPAVLLSAVMFVAHHILLLRGYDLPTPLIVVASAGIFIGGVVWSWCYHRFESVWPGFISHALVDVAVLAIGYFLIFG